MPFAMSSSNASKPLYTFDHLFYPENNNKEIFEAVVKGVVSKVMNGFHGAVFTYGQTSSGKTFTMTGNNSQPGVIPQAIQHCFDSINLFSDREFLVRVSYLEIYNEQVKDLLNNEPAVIKIQHDPKTNLTSLVGVKEQVVGSYSQTLSLIKSGETLRHVGATDMNEKSSRAHTLFRLTIESKERNSNAVLVSSLNLVDLAGSENAKQTNSKGERALEAKYINQSLLTLSTIIHKLSEEKTTTGAVKRQHLPYRDSKLTRILQPSLDGNAHIAVVCTISPTLSCLDETHNTLKFATRAKSVRMNAKVNEVMDEKTLLKVYREEIEQLKAKLFELEMQNKLQNQSKSSVMMSPVAESDQDDEEQELILQMISEMERMILKAEKPAVRPSDSKLLASPRKLDSISPTTSSTKSSPIADNSPVIKSKTTVKPSIVSSPVKQSVSRLTKVSNMMTGKSSEDKSSSTNATINKPVPEKRGSRLGFGFKTVSSPPKPAVSLQPSTTTTIEQISPPVVNKTVTFSVETTSSSATVEEDQSVTSRRSLSMESSNGNASPNLRASLQRVQSFRGDDVGDKVLFGVSKMLSALKMHIGRAKPAPVSKKSDDSYNQHSIPEKRVSSNSPLSPQTETIERLELSLRLKEADNRFLQEELEKKDKMLAMLTEGLREVESSQQEWLVANEELSRDLETALNDNDWLVREIERLKNLLIVNNILDPGPVDADIEVDSSSASSNHIEYNDFGVVSDDLNTTF
eukprot:CAMPEP_0196764274 /NCGR_PEP_ID=MMETSP1095-20130614/5787_1 /TAXON_ID=96789 ORGANISM="Chromulina nebulosa, Strain UTEXLB2642" /NCGR_SAMPLE_ID=MMETSP1095 /ASSEMBLY_ACC=CAM_ASM_000446 /LENGTH=744 /DNA_ID=CAMNT_0042119433 /DNA_START=117 /DNA_END=2351 /DNA_ORIENTATION=+